MSDRVEDWFRRNPKRDGEGPIEYIQRAMSELGIVVGARSMPEGVRMPYRDDDEAEEDSGAGEEEREPGEDG